MHGWKLVLRRVLRLLLLMLLVRRLRRAIAKAVGIVIWIHIVAVEMFGCRCRVVRSRGARAGAVEVGLDVVLGRRDGLMGMRVKRW